MVGFGFWVQIWTQTKIFRIGQVIADTYQVDKLADISNLTRELLLPIRANDFTKSDRLRSKSKISPDMPDI